MLKRKVFLDKKLILYKTWKKHQVNSLITKSFLKNYMLKPINRVSFIIKKNYSNNDLRYYKAQNKLQCFMSFSFKVPCKRINLSRFYLVRSANKLLLGGYQK